MSESLRPATDTYGFAPEAPAPVSTPDACGTTLSGGKREAVQGYLTKLGPELRRRYGKQTHYTPAQVRDTALVAGMNVDWICWGYVLYCSPADFDLIHSAAGEACDRAGMWGAVAGEFFQGNLAFDPMEPVGLIAGAAEGTADAAVAGIDLLGGLTDWW